MSKKKDLKRAQQDVFDAKIFFTKMIKRYGITLLIATPIIIALNFLLGFLIPGYAGTVMTVGIFVMLLLAVFLALVIFNKKDKRDEEKPIDVNKERDPFAD